jgi:hypothetical protein
VVADLGNTSPRWDLADYDWNPDTGIGTYTYERVREDTGETVTKVVTKEQPYAPNHAGWREWLAGQN